MVMTQVEIEKRPSRGEIRYTREVEMGGLLVRNDEVTNCRGPSAIGRWGMNASADD